MNLNALKNSIAWLDSLLETMIEAVIATDTANRILLMNSAAESLTGWALADVQGQDVGMVFQLIPNGDATPVNNSVIFNLNETMMSAILIAKTGSVTSIEARATMVHDEAGQVCGKLIIFRDVSETVQATNTLWNTVQRFRILTENSNDIILTLDAQAICRYASPSTGVILGYPLVEIIGKPIFEFIHPDDVNHSEKVVGRLIRGQVKEPIKAEWRLRHQNGSWRTIAISLANFLDHAPLNSLVLNGFDITSYREAKQALHESERFLQVTLDSLSAQIAVLDQSGEIIAVKGSWHNFAHNNNGANGNYDPGQSYMNVCEALMGRTSPEAEATVAGIRAVMSRQQQAFYLEYAHHNPSQQRWYSLKITPFQDDGPLRVVVAQEDITERALLEARLTAIHQLGQELTLLHDQEAIIHRVLDTIQWIVQFTSIEYGYVSYATKELIYRYRLVGDQLETQTRRLPLIAAEMNLGVIVVRNGQPQYIADVLMAPHRPEPVDGEEIRAELCVPLKVREKVTGVLHIKHTRPNSFTAADQRVFQTLSMQAAAALENARLYIETQRRTKELAALNRATRVVASTLDLNTVLKKTIAEVRTMLNIEGTAILLYDAKQEDLFFALTDGPYPDLLSGTRLSLSSGVAGWVARERKAAIVNDATSDPRFYSGIDAMTQLTTRSILATPILFQDKFVGVFEVINKFEEDFTRHDLELLESLSRSLAIAIENARLYEAERKQFHRLQQSHAQLSHIEKMAALGRLVGSIAHEINNPIQAIQNCMVLLEEEAHQRRRADKIIQFTTIAADEIKRIAAIVRRMLEFYDGHEIHFKAIGSASIDDFFHIAPEDFELVDLHKLLDSVLQLTQKQLQHKQIMIKRDWWEKPLFYRGSSDQLKQVFLNLVLNAIDAMSDQSGTLTIKTVIKPAADASEPKPVINIAFSDTGSGIEDNVLPNIFEPMFTTKEHGSGFGLFVCYKIIEAHGGQITVKSRLDEGATFTILLPLETNPNSTTTRF